MGRGTVRNSCIAMEFSGRCYACTSELHKGMDVSETGHIYFLMVLNRHYNCLVIAANDAARAIIRLNRSREGLQA